jgi:hypothetical protein
MENICQKWYTDLKDEESSDRQEFFTRFETLCKNADHEQISKMNPVEQANYINNYAFYCGLKFGIKELKALPLGTFKRNILIVDTMNVFQNMSLLIMALCVITFTSDEIEAIGLMIANKLCDFNKKIAIFNKIMSYFRGIDSTIIFVIQCDSSKDTLFEMIPQKHPSADCQLFKFSVPCLLRDKGRNVNCYNRNIKNESDDVVSLLLYYIISARNAYQYKIVTFWTYDNYNWFTGTKDDREINLMYDTNKVNSYIELIIGKEVYRKDQHTQAKIINFNEKGIYAWDKQNYKKVLTNLSNKYSDRIRIPQLAKISEIYEGFIKKYIKKNDIREDMEDDPEPDYHYMELDGGNFYKKYLKYKNKYLELKNKYGNDLH